MFIEKTIMKHPNTPYHPLDKDVQDRNYIDFEVMKKSVGKKTKFCKLALVEEVKQQYNNLTEDIDDQYVYFQKKKKRVHSSKFSLKNLLKPTIIVYANKE